MRSKQLFRLLILLILLGLGYYVWNKFFNTSAVADAKLVIRTDLPANNINPIITDGVAGSIYVAQQIFLTLGNFDPKTLDLIPVLVKNIPVGENISNGPYKGGVSYTFEVLEEARWDNGTPITGKDVEFSIKLCLCPSITSPFRSYYTDCKAVEVDAANPRKFKVVFEKPYILAIETICNTPVYPVYHYDPTQSLAKFSVEQLADKSQKAALEQNPELQAYAESFKQAKFKNDPASIVGSGAYRIESLTEQSVVLVKKDNWWGDALSKNRPILETLVKRIEYRTVPDETTAENMLRNGQLDVVAGSLSAGTFVKWKADPTLTTGYNFETVSTPVVNRWFFNCISPKLSDPKVRQALAHLVNYDYLINTVSQGFGKRLSSTLYPSSPYYATGIKPYDFNVDKAKSLLAEAGWTDSNGNGTLDKRINGVLTELVIEVMGPLSSPTVKGFFASVKDNALQAGIKIVESDATLQVMAQRAGAEIPDYESGVGASAISTSHYDFYDRYFSTNLPPAGQNRTRYKNPKADSLIMIHRLGGDAARIKDLYSQIQEVIHNDVPEVYLMAPVQRMVISKRWEPMLSENKPGYVEHRFKLKK